MAALTVAVGVQPAHASYDALDVKGLRGTLELKSMPTSPLLHRKITTWVYLPKGYDANDATKRYPVIYLLHGQPGGWTDCYLSGHVEEMADQLMASGAMAPAILVAFDGDGPKGFSDVTEFCNRVTDDYRMEDFIATELISYVDATYRTIPDAAHRALWGYSGGGFGALNLGLHHPDLWSIWASHAGFYSPDGDADAMVKILGPKKGNEAIYAANDPMQLVKKATSMRGLHIYMDGAPDDEDYPSFKTLSQEFAKREADVTAVVRKKAHAWAVITWSCKESLLFINKNWGGNTVVANATGVQSPAPDKITPPAPTAR